MSKIIKGDRVQVMTGRSRGQIGTVTKVLTDKNKVANKVIVEGSNLVKKHVKPNPNKNIEGGIIPQESPLSISNVAIYNDETKKADRVGYAFVEENGVKKKVRVFKSNQKRIDV